MNAEIIFNVVATALASTIAFCGGLAITAVILSKRRHRKPPFRQHINLELRIMKALSPFPHDPSYDADFVNGEIFDGNDDLSRVGAVAPRGPLPPRGIERPVRAVRGGPLLSSSWPRTPFSRFDANGTYQP